MAQTYLNREVIVIDDGSTDDTISMLTNEFPKIHLICLASNQGAAVARNSGMRVANGSFIAFLDSDDEWHPAYLAKQLASLIAHPDAVLSYTRFYHSYGNSYYCPTSGEPLILHDMVESLLMLHFLHTLSQIVIPRFIFERAGMAFDERLSICEDLELYLRLGATGKPVCVNEPLVVKHWRQDSLLLTDRCERWLQEGLKMLGIFFNTTEGARYACLRSVAESSLRRKVMLARQAYDRAAQTGELPFLGPKVEAPWARSDTVSLQR